MRGLTLQDEDLTVLFCKMQDFSSLNSLTIVYKVIAPSILASSSRLFFVLFVFYIGVFFFASDCLEPIVKNLTGDNKDIMPTRS